MYFNFDDNHPDTPRLPQPLSRREVVLIAVNHPRARVDRHPDRASPAIRARNDGAAAEGDRGTGAGRTRAGARAGTRAARFVFVQPKLDMTSPKVSPRADLSDKDRRAQTVQRAERPDNPLPFARGNSPERMEAPPTNLPPKPSVPEPPPSGAENSKPPLLSESPAAPERPPDMTRPSDARGPAVGVIADAIRNVRRYTQPAENFGNVRGGQDQSIGESIQFDSKGVEFGPWLARFIAQVRSNWMIPQAAMSMHGNVVDHALSCTSDGRITEVVVARPSAINAFTLSGRNAILTSESDDPAAARVSGRPDADHRHVLLQRAAAGDDLADANPADRACAAAGPARARCPLPGYPAGLRP